ncbi:MAG: hypothetical protein MK106_08240 [Mariniblastus sp.]|nr:hypothetical protein [Mariniblastus sp.]
MATKRLLKFPIEQAISRLTQPQDRKPALASKAGASFRLCPRFPVRRHNLQDSMRRRAELMASLERKSRLG